MKNEKSNNITLVDIQNELKVPKGNYNSFGKYKYRSAENILEAVKPILAKHGAILTITDDILDIGNKIYIKATATLTVSDKEYTVNGFAETGEHKGMSSEQCTGTASSYARKYALNGLFLIDETEADPGSQEYIDTKKEKIARTTDLNELRTMFASEKSQEVKKLIQARADELQKLNK